MSFTSLSLPRLSALALAAVLAANQAAQAETLTVTGVPGTTVQGQTSMLQLAVELSQSLAVEGLALNLTWQSTGLSFNAAQSTVLGLSWASLAGLVDWSLSAPPTDAPGAFGLSVIFSSPVLLPASTATVSLAFKGEAEGVYDVLTEIVLAYDGGLSSLDGSNITAMTVTAVPEPTPTALLLGGLAVLGWLAKRRAA